MDADTCASLDPDEQCSARFRLLFERFPWTEALWGARYFTRHGMPLPRAMCQRALRWGAAPPDHVADPS